MLNQAVDLNTIPFAVPWRRKDIGENRILMTHESNHGCMIYDANRQIVMLFNSDRPTAGEILESTEFHMKNRDEAQPMEERFLQAEANLIWDMKNPAERIRLPFLVFPELHKAVAVVECIFEAVDGRIESEYAVFVDPLRWQAFQAAQKLLLEAQETGNKIKDLTARNSLHFLTGNVPASRYFVVYQDGKWQTALVREVNGDEDFDDIIAHGLVRCPVCGFNTRIMFMLTDRGDRMSILEHMWQEHREKNPDCKGLLRV